MECHVMLHKVGRGGWQSADLAPEGLWGQGHDCHGKIWPPGVSFFATPEIRVLCKKSPLLWLKNRLAILFGGGGVWYRTLVFHPSLVPQTCLSSKTTKANMMDHLLLISLLLGLLGADQQLFGVGFFLQQITLSYLSEMGCELPRTAEQ